MSVSRLIGNRNVLLEKTLMLKIFFYVKEVKDGHNENPSGKD